MSINLSPYWREKLSCAYFFACPGIVYGIFTSRLPALKELTAANDANIGFLLLAFGAASFCGLLSSSFIMDKIGARILIGITSLLLACSFIIAGLAFNFWQLLGFGMLGGLSMGLCDVSMNAQGIIIEKRHHQRSLSFFHASYSLGGVTGALTGSIFAALSLSPFLNFIIILGLYFLLWPIAFKNIKSEKPEYNKNKKQKSQEKLPLVIFILGFMSMGCYVSEGSIGEWGSILLHSVKGANQDLAALVFACFSTTMVLGRFCGDSLRGMISDFKIVFCGTLIGMVGMVVILLTSSPAICLIAYACMGIGFAPIVPIFFSRAGSVPGVSPGRASSVISLLSYSGLLVVPPFIGVLAKMTGLDNALWLIVLIIFGIFCGNFTLRQKKAAINAYS